MTYNYAPHFYRTLGGRGIRGLYGLTALESIPVLTRAITQLGNDHTPDYWTATEGNAREALIDLLALAQQAVDEQHGHAVWSGD